MLAMIRSYHTVGYCTVMGTCKGERWAAREREKEEEEEEEEEEAGEGGIGENRGERERSGKEGKRKRHQKYVTPHCDEKMMRMAEGKENNECVVFSTSSAIGTNSVSLAFASSSVRIQIFDNNKKQKKVATEAIPLTLLPPQQQQNSWRRRKKRQTRPRAQHRLALQLSAQTLKKCEKNSKERREKT